MIEHCEADNVTLFLLYSLVYTSSALTLTYCKWAMQMQNEMFYKRLVKVQHIYRETLVYKIRYFLNDAVLSKSWCWYPICCSSESGSVWLSVSSDVSWEAPFSFSGIFSATSYLQHGGHLWEAAVCFPPLNCLCDEWASKSPFLI